MDKFVVVLVTSFVIVDAASSRAYGLWDCSNMSWH